jgi:hypothetical protein
MFNKKIKVLLVIVAMSGAVITGCYKNASIINAEGEEITRPVSFSNDIVPIFNKSCNLSGCHNAGGKAPNLTSANAYNALTEGNYVNTTDPKNSELYLWMTGKKGTPMPLSGPNKEFNALVLAWIKQGASNN